MGLKLTIITVNLNDKDGLESTIKSVLNQTYSKFQYIIIDGNSTDGSKEIIKKYQDRVSIWKSEPDQGIYHAMNKGIQLATGEFCLFLNSADILCNNTTLENVLKVALTGDIINFDSVVKTTKKEEIVRTKKKITFYHFYKHTIIHQATFIRRDLFKKIGLYNQTLRIVSDWEFFIKALFIHNCSYQSIPIQLSVFDANGISSKPETQLISKQEREMTLRKLFPLFMDDYELIKKRPVYNYLLLVNKYGFLKLFFYLRIRLINRLLKKSIV